MERRTTVLGTAAAGLLLLLAAPTPPAAVRTLRDAGAATDPTAPLVAAIALLAWALALWLALTVLATLAGRLPGVAGRAAAAVSRRIAPATVRRAVEVALGLTVAVGTLGASPAAAAPGTAGPAAAPPAAAASLDWAAPPAAPALDWSAPPPAADLDWAAAVPPAAEPVVVQPGDTLWGLAASALEQGGDADVTDAEVAQAWPSWWAANREVVGDDPDVITPGTQLSPPGDPSAGPASS